MSAYNLAPIANFFSIFGGNTAGSASNVPLAGGTISTFAAGSSTPLQTYKDNLGVTGWGTVITLDSTGRVPGEIWFPAGQGYKFTLKDASGNVISTSDNLVGVNDIQTVASAEWIASGSVPTYGGASQFSTTGNSTSTFKQGRRIQATVTAGTVYGTVVSSTFGTATTVVLDMDVGQALDSGLTAVNVGLLGTTGIGVSVPMYWQNDLTLRNLTANGVTVGPGGATFSGGIIVSAGSISAPSASIPIISAATQVSTAALLATSAAVSGPVSGTTGTFTGAVTAANGATGTQVVNISQFIPTGTTSGYVTLPGGLMFQWGSGTATNNSGSTITFPTSFPTACWHVYVTATNTGIPGTNEVFEVGSLTTTQFTCWASNAATRTVGFFAIGN